MVLKSTDSKNEEQLHRYIKTSYKAIIHKKILQNNEKNRNSYRTKKGRQYINKHM